MAESERMKKSNPGLLLCLTLALPAHAHHSFAVHFLPDDSISVSGTITEFRFSNPHGIAHFTVVNESGEEELWRAETNSPNVLRRRGWSRDSLKPGDEVTLEGWPARDDSRYMRIRVVTFADGRVLGTQRGASPDQD